ncbi:hypothetical protein A7982_12218 [Minicystis rosea]|nr:hypothetical protein A7982_12218 [Minicystis rosea]
MMSVEERRSPVIAASASSVSPRARRFESSLGDHHSGVLS